MFSFLLLATTVSAQEACPERISPEVLTERIEAIRSPVAEGKEEIGPNLNQLFRIAAECVDGPVEKRDLGAILLARGVWGLKTGLVKRESALRQMTWAYGIAGRDVFDEIYGYEMEEDFDEATDGVLPKAFIELAFAREPRVVVIDGEVVYERGKVMVTATFHLIQWLDAKGWHSAKVVLEEGEEISIGGGNPQKEKKQQAQKSTSKKKKTKKAKSKKPKKTKTKKTQQQKARELARSNAKKPKKTKKPKVQKPPKPKRVKKKVLGPRTHIAADTTYGLILGRFAHETGAAEGGVTMPSMRFNARFDAGHIFGLFGSAEADGGLIVDTYPAAANYGALGIWFGKRRLSRGWNLNLGASYRTMPSASGSGPKYDDGFTQSPELGAHASLELRRINLHLSTTADIFPTALFVKGQAQYVMRLIKPLRIRPTAGLSASLLITDFSAETPDRMLGLQGSVGLKRSF